MSFQTAPVTGSLVSDAANLRVAEFGTLFQYIADLCLGNPWDSVFIGDGDTDWPAAGRQVRC